MKRMYVIVIVVFLAVLAGGVYLNRAYANLYSRIGRVALRPSDTIHRYQVGNTNASAHVIYDAVGDSLTAGVGVAEYPQSYPYLVAQLMSAQNRLVTLNDRSIPGATSQQVQDELLPQVIFDQPDVVTIMIGVNDVRSNVDQAVFAKHYETILQAIKSETRAKIYLVNIPFIGAKGTILPPFNSYYDAQTRAFNQTIQGLAARYGATYIDVYSPTKARFSDTSYYSPDLFHPSAKGYGVWAKVIYDALGY
jgi:lysophospholipase L1-like esterase